MSRGEFYVGYLPMPARHHRAVRVIVGAAFLLLMIAGVVMAASQRDPGEAVWDTASEREFTGLVLANPYPMLETDKGTYLVVESGKVGSQRRLGPFDRRRVTLRGYLLERDGRRMIELAPREGAVESSGGGGASDTTLFAGPEATFTGEILDSKCYLGAMKPGDGKGHKACATLCIDGGIPPMLYTRHADGSPAYYVLAQHPGDPVGEYVRPYIGEPVRVRGMPLDSDRGVSLLLIEAGSIERVGF